MGEFTTDTGCLITSYELYDDDTVSGNLLSSWTASQASPGQPLIVTLPQGTENIVNTYNFYLKVIVDGTTPVWAYATSIAGSTQKFFTINVVGNSAPTFNDDIPNPIECKIDSSTGALVPEA